MQEKNARVKTHNYETNVLAKIFHIICIKHMSTCSDVQVQVLVYQGGAYSSWLS